MPQRGYTLPELMAACTLLGVLMVTCLQLMHSQHNAAQRHGRLSTSVLGVGRTTQRLREDLLRARRVDYGPTFLEVETTTGARIRYTLANHTLSRSSATGSQQLLDDLLDFSVRRQRELIEIELRLRSIQAGGGRLLCKVDCPVIEAP